MKKCFLAIILSFYLGSVVAQIADTIELRNVNITAKNSYGTAAVKAQKIDSMALIQYQSGSLGELLQSATPIFVKQYGSNGVQTVTFRGMAGAHTGVFLNGLNINPSSLGLTDLSVYPSFLFTDVDLKYGNAAFTEGNGTLGGGIMLKSRMDVNSKKPTLALLAGLGSYGKKQIGLACAFGSKRLKSSTRFIWNEANNNFEYSNIFKKNSPLETQNHAFNSIYGVHQQFTYLLNSRNSIFINFLYADLYRQIPKLMTTEQPSKATQEDKNIIAQIGWKHYGKTFQIKNILGYAGSDLHFVNPSINTDAITLNHKAQFRQDLKKNFSEISSISMVLNYSYATAENLNLNQQNAQSEGSMLAIYNRKMGKWEWSGSLKGGFNNGEGYLLPMISVGFIPLEKKSWVIGANFAKNQKFASLNDLYWVPGGNPDLAPEIANTIEINNQFNNLVKSNSLTADANFYFSEVTNWILWKPSGQGYWMAQNVQQVLCYGSEIQAKFQKHWNDHAFHTSASYNWVITKNNSEDPALKGKQLIYTPMHQGNVILDYTYNQFGVSYGQNFFGKRYTSSDNSSYIPAYSTANLAFHSKLSIENHGIDLRLSINNLWDTSYTVVLAQPMMGRNLMITLKYKLN